MKPIHLLRGSPAVRSWSKYQTTVPAWTLCGIERKDHGSGFPAGQAAEDPEKVTCDFCRELMKNSREKIMRG